MTEPPPAASWPRAGLALVTLVVIGAWALSDTLPRDSAPDSDALATAQAHVEAIAVEPHPPGTPAHRAVAGYLLTVLTNLGLEVEVQWADVVYDHPARNEHHVRAARVQNVLARLPGTGSGPALVLMSHYDSRPGGPGAADAAAGVAAVLEAARALTADPAPVRDVWFVLTDAEEIGLMGAQALFRQHTLKDRAGLVINFEARGSAGPSQLFETGPGNGPLIAEVARALSPIGSSVAYEIYRFMPNDTDLTISKGEGLPGLNFAFADRFFDYHTEGDTPENLSPGSLAGHVDAAVRLGRHFSQLETLPAPGDNHTFFNPVPGRFVHYGPTAARMLAAMALVLTLLVLVRHRAHWRLGGLEIPRAVLAAVIVAVVVSHLLESGHDLLLQGAGWSDAHYWRLFYRYPVLMAGYGLVVLAVTAGLVALLARGLTRRECLLLPGALVLLALAAGRFHPSIYIGLAVIAGALWWCRRPLGAGRLQAGGLVLWSLLAVALTWRMPTAAYLAVLPLIWVSAWLWPMDGQRFGQVLGAVVGPLVLWLPLVYGFYLVLGVTLPHFPALAGTLVLLLAPGLGLALGSAPRITFMIAVAGVGLLLFAITLPVFDERHREPTELFLWHDAASGDALWASGDREVNEWTRAVLGEAPAARPRSDLVPGATGQVLTAAWTGEPPEPARVSVIEDRVEAGRRFLRLRLSSPAGAHGLRLWFEDPGRIRGASLEGWPVPVPASFDPDETWRWRHDGLPETGLRLDLVVEGEAPIQGDLVEVIHDGVSGQLASRPTHLMRRPYRFSDTRLIRQRLALGGADAQGGTPPSSGRPSAAPGDGDAPGSRD